MIANRTKMEFRCKIEIDHLDLSMDYNHTTMLVGSCFATNMYEKLSGVKMPATCNPFGVLYNPLSIYNMINSLTSLRTFDQSDLVQCNDLWCSFNHHSSFSHYDQHTVLEMINSAAQNGAKELMECSTVIITFGTAWIYETEGFGVVANCHKFKPSTFTRKRLGVEEIVDRFDQLLKNQLKDKKVIFTVSPIRHLKDGLQENSLSKSILRVAVAELVTLNQNAHYFPSFEIMNDDLRDYRFYQEDMIHPSAVAIKYIWELLKDAAFSKETIAVMEQVESIMKACRHRPFLPQSDSYQKFIAKTIDSINSLENRYKLINFNNERNLLESKLL